MASMPRLKTASVSGSKAATSDGSMSSRSKDSMPLGASANLSSAPTTATTPKGSPRTRKSADLAELQSKIGLVAGALSDWQTAGGLVVLRPKAGRLASGREVYFLQILVAVDGYKIVKRQTVDGVDLDLVAVDVADSGMVAQ